MRRRKLGEYRDDLTPARRLVSDEVTEAGPVADESDFGAARGGLVRRAPGRSAGTAKLLDGVARVEHPYELGEIEIQGSDVELQVPPAGFRREGAKRSQQPARRRIGVDGGERSEERRVGKESRLRCEYRSEERSVGNK